MQNINEKYTEKTKVFIKMHIKLPNFFNNKKTELAIKHPVYGKVYEPIYNVYAPISPGKPEIYNKNGELMDVFFIRDLHFAHNPYYIPTCPTKFIWDRFNIGLDTHFYSHNTMLETMGNPKYRYGLLIESRAIVPEDYKIFDKNPELYKDFDAVFTYDADILDKIPNAKFMPLCAEPWYGTNGRGKVDANAYQHKTKNVSIVSSDKTSCDLHMFRLNLARRCRDEKLCDTFGTFDGGAQVNIADTLTKYRYSIVIENDISPYFFTERITNCFMSMTVPIYCGAPEIGKFFNMDGIICIKPGDDIAEVLKFCTNSDYQSRIPAILDNFERVLKYTNIWDLMYNEYLKDKK